jgi:hypothetical protein
VRAERALLALAVHTQQLDGRVARLENRVDESDTKSLEVPSLDDLLDVRVHSARVAAELSRVTVELRAEIDTLTSVLSREGGPRLVPVADRVRELADEIIDLSDAFELPVRRWEPGPDDDPFG